jgi:hypothetical protein
MLDRTNMNLSIEKTEHYTQIGSDQNYLNQLLAEEIVKQAEEQLSIAATLYFVFDINKVTEVEANALITLQTFAMNQMENAGLALFINENTEVHELFSEHDLVIVPTQSEAVEFIYMDQLEKQFLTDSE